MEMNRYIKTDFTKDINLNKFKSKESRETKNSKAKIIFNNSLNKHFLYIETCNKEYITTTRKISLEVPEEAIYWLDMDQHLLLEDQEEAKELLINCLFMLLNYKEELFNKENYAKEDISKNPNDILKSYAKEYASSRGIPY